ncbi:MAG: LuxR C-terminal-related transcriptional regulator [Nocardioides sp.]
MRVTIIDDHLLTREGIASTVASAERIRKGLPGVGVLVLSQYIEAEFATRLVTELSGGVGYLLKDRQLDPGMLIDGLKRIADGVLDDLTARELEVLKAMAEGLSNTAIGRRLFISERTLEVHTRRVFEKLGIHQDPGRNKRVAAAITYLAAITG